MRHQFFHELRALAASAAVAVLAASLLSATGCSGGASGPAVATVNLRLDRATVPVGGPIEMTFRFSVSPDLMPMADDYTVFVHVLDNNGERIWNDDHELATPTSEWEPGQTIEYSRRIMVPLYPYIGEGEIAVGLYLPSTGERLVLAGDDIGHNAYRTASITFTRSTRAASSSTRTAGTGPNSGPTAKPTGAGLPATRWSRSGIPGVTLA